MKAYIHFDELNINAMLTRFFFPFSLVLTAKWQDPSVRGALYKALSCLCFAGIYGCVRYFTLTAQATGMPSIPAPELAFFETLFGLLFLLPWVMSHGEFAIKVNHLPLYIGRAVVVSLGIILWFMALSKMSMIQVVSFKYTAPFFTLLGAKFFLKEQCGWRRGIAIFIALIGAILVTGNEFFSGKLEWTDFSILLLLPLTATACHALSAIFGKKQAKSESPQIISLYLLLLTLPILGVASIFEWVTPLTWQWPWLIMMGGLLACAYIFLSQAYVISDITYLIPVSFTRLVAAALIGIVFFSEWPTFWTWIGIFLILGATVCLCQFEALLTKKRDLSFVR